MGVERMVKSSKSQTAGAYLVHAWWFIVVVNYSAEVMRLVTDGVKPQELLIALLCFTISSLLSFGNLSWEYSTMTRHFTPSGSNVFASNSNVFFSLYASVPLLTWFDFSLLMAVWLHNSVTASESSSELFVWACLLSKHSSDVLSLNFF